MNDLLLALDYGGTKLTAGLLAAGPRPGGEDVWLAHSRVYSPSGADAAYDRAAMFRMAHELLARSPGRLAAVGVSFGGPVDANRGVVRLSHHVPGWDETPLRDQLRAEFRAPVAVDNDANVAALGEWKLGAGQGCASMLYVTISTGIGGGWVLNGRIYDGADGMAGEIGHVVVRPGGAACVCGKRGCLEAEACGPAIARAARELLAARPGEGRELRALAKGDTASAPAAEAVTAQLVAQAAQAGDSLAGEVLEEAARMLGAGLGGAINLMNPERVILGGGVTKSGEHWWQVVRETARGHVLPQARVEILPAALGDDAPLWGAAALAASLI